MRASLFPEKFLLRMPVELAFAVRRQAAAEGQTLSEWMRSALRAQLLRASGQAGGHA